MQTDNLPIDKIAVRADARPVDRERIDALAQSIAELGLMSPIQVRPLGDGWEVVFGAHRLQACQSLGLAEIEAFIVTSDDLHAELAMIDENLCRAELSPADRARQTARRKAIYEELNPGTQHGATGGNHVPAEKVERFSADTAKLTGQSERSIQRDAERGEKVLAEVVDLIRGTSLDTGTYLDKLKKMPGSEQYKAATRDLAFANQRQRQDERSKADAAKRNKIQGDVKARAAKEVAEMIAEHVPDEWWDAIKANLYAAGASNIAHELTNITGQSVMDRKAS